MIYLDADACPVRDQVFRVAAWNRVPLTIVANRKMPIPFDPKLMAWMVVVPRGQDVVDNWIVERTVPGDLVLTSDLLLAAHIVLKRVRCLDFRGREFQPVSDVDALDLYDVITRIRGPERVSDVQTPSYSQCEKEQFEMLFDETVSEMLRAVAPKLQLPAP